MVVVFAAAVLFGIEITSIIQLRREAKEDLSDKIKQIRQILDRLEKK